MKGSRKIQCVDGEWTALPVCIGNVLKVVIFQGKSLLLFVSIYTFKYFKDEHFFVDFQRRSVSVEIYLTLITATSSLLSLPITMETRLSSVAEKHLQWLDPDLSRVLVERGPSLLSALVRIHISN